MKMGEEKIHSGASRAVPLKESGLVGLRVAMDGMVGISIVNLVDVNHAILILLHKNETPQLVGELPQEISTLKILPVAVWKLAGIRVADFLEAT